MTVNIQFATQPSANDQPFYNYGAAILAGTPVSVDTVNYIGAGSPVNQGPNVIPVAAVGNVVIGVTMEAIAQNGSGRVRCLGPTAVLIADGAITPGQIVDASNTANRSCKAHTGGKFQLGVALSNAADGDNILVMLIGANNA